MPGLFILGLLLIPLGMPRERRAQRAGVERTSMWPVLNLNNPRQWRIALIVTSLTVVNVFIVALAGFKSVHYMDSVQFCGTVCHEVMQPEFASYEAGPQRACYVRAVSHGARRPVVRAVEAVGACVRYYAVGVQHALAPDSVAGGKLAPGARHVRAVPLARAVPWRQNPRRP